MSDRGSYPVAYRRNAPPSEVLRGRGFQPAPLPQAFKAPSKGLKYLKWAGRLARLHPGIRALSTALDIIDLLTPPGVPGQGGPLSVEIPGYEMDRDYSDCACPGPFYRALGSTGCTQGGRYEVGESEALGTFVYFTYSCTDKKPSDTPNGQAQQSRGGYRFRKLPGQPEYGPIDINPAKPRPFVPGRVTFPGSSDPVSPQWQPELWPIGRPAPAPVPVPYPSIPGRVPNPGRSPTEQSDWGNNPPAPEPNPEVVPTPGVIELPTEPGPTPEPDPTPWPDHRFPSPPNPTRTRERKTILAVGGVPARIISAATESADVIDAFWDAMPNRFKKPVYDRREKRWRKMRPTEKLEIIWENLDDLDIGQAFTNLAYEQLEDMAYGRLGRLQARAARKRGAMHGFTLGPAL